MKQVNRPNLLFPNAVISHLMKLLFVIVVVFHSSFAGATDYITLTPSSLSFTCAGGSQTFTIATNTPSQTIGYNGCVTSATRVGNTVTVTVGPNSSYPTGGAVTVTCPTAGAGVGVSQAGYTAATVSAGPAIPTFCAGTTSAPLGGSVGGSATGGTWSSNAGGIFSPSATSLNATWTPPAGYYGNPTLTLTTTGGCSTAIASKSLSVSPAPGISLSTGNNIQTAYTNTPISPIRYSVYYASGGIATGLPAGVTGSLSGNTFTISGTPTVSGTFNYTVTFTTSCNTNVSVTGTITVNAAPADYITLTPSSLYFTSAGGSQTFTISTNTSSQTINCTEPFITATRSGNTVTVTCNSNPGCSGRGGGVTVIGGTTGAGVSVNQTGATVSISLTSTAGTNAQTVAFNSPIAAITYATTSVTGATVTGLPNGVNATWANNVVTISGTPIQVGVFNYTVTASSGCAPVTATGTITVCNADYGLLYNWYVINGDERRIAPSGWHVPTFQDFYDLSWSFIPISPDRNIDGILLRETGATHWDISYNAGLNIVGFSAVGSGIRNPSFSGLKSNFNIWSSEYDELEPTQAISWVISNLDSIFWYSIPKKCDGLSIRLIKDDSTNPGTFTDIDGNIYPTVKIGNQVWMAANLKVRSYNDGTPIPNVTDNAAWAALTTGAYCQYPGTVIDFDQLKSAKIPAKSMGAFDNKQNPVENASSIQVLPNPTEGIITIVGLPANEKSKIAVYSLNGKLIDKKETDSSSATLDISSQPSGTYMLIINKQSVKVIKK